jgi:hypothetical protein
MGLKYIGQSFIRGVPARDLTDEEAEKYGKKRLVSTGLYIDDKPPEVRKKKLREAVKREGDDPSEVNSNGWS